MLPPSTHTHTHTHTHTIHPWSLSRPLTRGSAAHLSPELSQLLVHAGSGPQLILQVLTHPAQLVLVHLLQQVHLGHRVPASESVCAWVCLGGYGVRSCVYLCMYWVSCGLTQGPGFNSGLGHFLHVFTSVSHCVPTSLSKCMIIKTEKSKIFVCTVCVCACVCMCACECV